MYPFTFVVERRASRTGRGEFGVRAGVRHAAEAAVEGCGRVEAGGQRDRGLSKAPSTPYAT